MLSTCYVCAIAPARESVLFRVAWNCFNLVAITAAFDCLRRVSIYRTIGGIINIVGEGDYLLPLAHIHHHVHRAGGHGNHVIFSTAQHL